jgi:hypothetical protein
MSKNKLEELENSKFEVMPEEEQQKVEGGSFRGDVTEVINFISGLFR